MSNFLKDYITYNQGNEAHEHFHFWCGVVAMSCLVSRKVWVNLEYFKIYPNLYVCLIGPPGFGKNTALNAAKRLIREIGDVKFSAECQTKEAIIKELAGNETAFDRPGQEPLIYTPLSIFVTELSQFIGIDPARMLDFLVTVYDADVYDMKTKKEGHQVLPGPHINLLSATTPMWITKYLKEEVISGGFNRRCLFVLEHETSRRIAFPKITKEMYAAWERCKERGHWLKTFANGEFAWDPEAEAYYQNWYETRELSADDDTRDFDKTKSILVLKVAMLLALSKRDALVLDLECIQTALAALDKVQAKLPDVYRSLGRNELAQVSSKFEGHLRRASRPIPEKVMKALLWRDASAGELYAVSTHLIQTGRVRVVEDNGNKCYKLNEHP